MDYKQCRNVIGHIAPLCAWLFSDNLCSQSHYFRNQMNIGGSTRKVCGKYLTYFLCKHDLLYVKKVEFVEEYDGLIIYLFSKSKIYVEKRTISANMTICYTFVLCHFSH